MLEQHVIIRRQAQAGSQNVIDASALLEQSVYDGGAGWHQRRLAQITQNREHRMKTGIFRVLRTFELDASAEFGEQDEVKDYGGGEETVLAGVVHGDRVQTPHHYLGGIFVHCTFRIT